MGSIQKVSYIFYHYGHWVLQNETSIVFSMFRDFIASKRVIVSLTISHVLVQKIPVINL